MSGGVTSDTATNTSSSADRTRVPAALLEAVVADFDPRKIILFGSAARGDHRPGSDIDLLVLLDDDAPCEKQTLRGGFESRRGYRMAADVIPYMESAFRTKAQIGGTIAHAALTEGVTVYERA